MSKSTSAAVATGNISDDIYNEYVKKLQARFESNLRSGDPLVTTDADLWNAYLESFTDDQRQHHNCHACREFLRKYGSLAMIRPDGLLYSPIWSKEDAPPEYREMAGTLAVRISLAKVTGVFRSSEPVWGRPVTGQWTHYAIKPPHDLLWTDRVRTAGQAMAEKQEDFRTVMIALNEFTERVLEKALELLRSETLYRSEHVIGPAEWLLELHRARSGHRLYPRANIVWRAVALAPPGFCHPRSSMIGTLLEDLSSGMLMDAVARRFRDKMHPLQYQRPQSPPSSGNIVQAEKIVEKLGIAPSLRRRFARLEEIPCLWNPSTPRDSPLGGVFEHLTPKDAHGESTGDAPLVKMTWDKFRRTVLPTALSIQYRADGAANSYGALVTAVNPDAPPILQWDTEHARNPVSWYQYAHGSLPTVWNIPVGWNPVTGIAFLPMMWQDETAYSHHSRGLILLIRGAADRSRTDLALFPEILKSELREVRSTIEAHSASKELEGREEASACGLILQQGNTWRTRLRVRTKTGSFLYHLDRWD